MGGAMMTRLLLAITLIVASAGAAHAEPVTATFAAISAFLSSTTIAGVSLSTILQVAAFAAGVALQALGGGRKAIDPGEAKSTLDLAEGEELRAVGRVLIGGLKVYGNSTGYDRYRVIAHCKGEIAAIEDYRVGGRSVIVEPDGAVSSPPYVIPGNSSYVYVLSKLGTSTETAYSALVSAFPDIWTTDHRGRGVAQSLIKYISPGITSQKFGRMYQGGEPELQLLIRGEEVYDPRTDTTAWTDNSILIIRHVLLGFPEWSADYLDDDFIADEADRADELVDTLTGTEKRSRLWGIWSSETGREDVLDSMLRSAGAWIVMRPSGKWGIQLIDDDQSAEFTFVERDILDWTWKSGPDGVSRPNICRVKYYSPENNYEMAEINTGYGTAGGTWARIEDEITRYGPKPLDLDLLFCPSASQAQRVARLAFARARADVGSIKSSMVGMAAWGARTALIPMPDLGGSIVAEIEAPRIGADDVAVDIPYRVWPTLAAWDPETMESPAPEIVPDLAYQSEVPTPGAMSNAIVVQYIGGGYETRVLIDPPILTAGSPPTVPATYYTTEASYRTFTDDLPNPWQSMTEVINGTYEYNFAYISSSLVGAECEFRSFAFNADEDGSNSSPAYSVVPALSTGAPSAPTITAETENTGSNVNITLTVRAPADIKVVRLELSGLKEYPSTNETTQINVRPNETIVRTITVPALLSSIVTITWTARCYSTGNVASSDVTYTYEIPAA